MGSAARNAGQAGSTGGKFGDRRGTSFPRVQFVTIDIGAFEATPLPTGDCDANGKFVGIDIDALVAAIASENYAAQLDLDGNAVLDEADVDARLANAGAVNLPSGGAIQSRCEINEVSRYG